MDEIIPRKTNKIQIAFSAIDQRLVNNIPSRREVKSKTYVTYGDRNDYPNFLFDTYCACPSLSTIINGLADYVVGDGVSSTMPEPNPGMTWDEFINHLAADYLLYGVCYFEVIEGKNNTPRQLYWLDTLYVRSDEDNETFYYNEKFGSSYVKASDTITFPRFKIGFSQPSSVVMIKTPLGKGTYGSPLWLSGLKAVMTEVAIDDFHLNEIDNNFTASAIINFNNGTPNDEEKAEIEKLIRKKFTGHENGGRFMMSFNNGKDNATTVERLSTDDFDERYNALAEKTQKQIFTAFGVSPVIFGVEKETTGFNSEDYKQAYKLANKTKISPIQKRLIDAIERVIGKGTMTIAPFSINWDENENNNEEVIS